MTRKSDVPVSLLEILRKENLLLFFVLLAACPNLRLGLGL